MKWLFVSILCLFFLVCAQAAEDSIESLPQPDFELQSMIEPPMPLSEELPIVISIDNKNKYVDNPALRQRILQQNHAILKNREFPWIPILAAITVLVVIALIRNGN